MDDPLEETGTGGALDLLGETTTIDLVVMDGDEVSSGLEEDEVDGDGWREEDAVKDGDEKDDEAKCRETGIMTAFEDNLEHFFPIFLVVLDEDDVDGDDFLLRVLDFDFLSVFFVFVVVFSIF